MNQKLLKIFKEIDLYFITDDKLTKRTVFEDVKSAIKAGVKIIQYREKEKSTREMIEEAAQIKELCKNKAIFLINNRIDIALAVKADGVHLGQDDIPYEIARSLIGGKIIGLTVHNVGEAMKAEKLGADYISVSPIFETKTKFDAGPAIGIESIKDIKKSVNIPLIVIGGINLENIDDVIKAGITSIAAISAIVTKDDVEGECRKFINKLKNNQTPKIKR